MGSPTALTVAPAISGGLWKTSTKGGDKGSIPDNSGNKVFEVTPGR